MFKRLFIPSLLAMLLGAVSASSLPAPCNWPGQCSPLSPNTRCTCAENLWIVTTCGAQDMCNLFESSASLPFLIETSTGELTAGQILSPAPESGRPESR